MPAGTVEVMLVNARGLKSGDFFSKTDAYAIVSCGNQSQKSNVARNQGSNPKWNQTFVFCVEEDVCEVTMRIMDEDLLSADDELGTVTVPLASVFQAGSTAATAYNVVHGNGKFKGEVKLSLAFTPKQRPESSEGGSHSSFSTHGPSGLDHGSMVEGPYGRSHADGPYGSGGWNQGA